MATTIFSSTTTITTTTLLYRNTEEPAGHSENPSSPVTVSSSEPDDSVSLETSKQSETPSDYLAQAAKNYLVALNTANLLLGNREDDSLSAFARYIINAGSGDDRIDVAGRSRIRGGSGDDIINALGRSHIHGGSGDDVITAVGRSNIRGGSGDDIINVFGRSRINAGSGDDVINVLGRSNINAGSGDDIINAYGRSRISGGAGDDVILVGGDRATVDFRKGDGSDTIYAATDVRINIGAGLTTDSLNIAYDAGKATITFEGSDDELTLYFEEGSLRLNFANGRSLDLTPNIDVNI